MKNYEKAKDHLLFLGYKVDEEKEDHIFLRHQNHATLMLFAMGDEKSDEGVSLSIGYPKIKDLNKTQKTDLFEKVAWCNARLFVSVVVIDDKQTGMMFRARFPFEYNKTVFGEFMSHFQEDWKFQYDANWEEFFDF